MSHTAAVHQVIDGNWDQLKGKIHETWGEISDDDLEKSKGNYEQFVGLLKERTGKTRHEIETQLSAWDQDVAEKSEGLLDSAMEYGEEMADTIRRNYENATEDLQKCASKTTDVVRKNPEKSVAITFGAGLLTGVVVGLILRSR